MDQEQRKKWSEKLSKAEEVSGSVNPTLKSHVPDMNKIKNKYIDLSTDNEEENEQVEGIIDLTPDPSVEEDITIGVQTFNELHDADDDIISEKKLIITSKSGRKIGFEG